MQVLSPTTTNTGKVKFTIEEAIQCLVIKIMYPKTDANLFNLFAGMNMMLNMSLKSRGSIEKNICNSIPLLRIAQFGQYRKGYYQYIYDGNSAVITSGNYVSGGMIGLIAIVPLTESGSLKMNADEYLEGLLTELPTGTIVSIQGVESASYSDHYMQYEKGGVPTIEREKSFNTNDLYDSLLVPASPYIEREFASDINSYANPMDRLTLFYDGLDKPDCSLNTVDIRTLNVVKNGNDIVSMWAKTDATSEPFFSSQSLTPKFYLNDSTEKAQDIHGLYHSNMKHGFDDWGVIDLDNVDRFKVYKNADQDFPFYTERKINN